MASELMDEMVKALPRKGGPRTTLVILAAAVGLVLSGAAAYGALTREREAAIDKRIRPIKIRSYEQEAVLEHIFDHIESQQPSERRHRLEDVKRLGRVKLREDESGDGEGGGDP